MLTIYVNNIIHSDKDNIHKYHSLENSTSSPDRKPKNTEKHKTIVIKLLIPIQKELSILTSSSSLYVL